MRVDTKTQSIALFNSAENVCVGQLRMFYALPMSTKDHKRVTNIDLGLGIHVSTGKSATTESVNNKDRLYFELKLWSSNW